MGIFHFSGKTAENIEFFAHTSLVGNIISNNFYGKHFLKKCTVLNLFHFKGEKFDGFSDFPGKRLRKSKFSSYYFLWGKKFPITFGQNFFP